MVLLQSSSHFGTSRGSLAFESLGRRLRAFRVGLRWCAPRRTPLGFPQSSFGVLHLAHPCRPASTYEEKKAFTWSRAPRPRRQLPPSLLRPLSPSYHAPLLYLHQPHQPSIRCPKPNGASKSAQSSSPARPNSSLSCSSTASTASCTNAGFTLQKTSSSSPSLLPSPSSRHGR